MKLTLKAQPGATPISFSDAYSFFLYSEIAAGERRGKMTTYGPWSVITSFKALAVTATWKPGPAGCDYVDEYTLHGDRTMSRPRQSGYGLDGYVSIDGVKRSCFTSSILFELPDGQLIDVAVMHARTQK